MGNLSFEELQTGIVFGFFKRVLSIAKQTDVKDFLFAWDSVKSKRKIIFPEYKAHRSENKTEEEIEENKLIYAQFDAIRQDILPYIGYNNIFHQPGFEADDLIASIIRNNLLSEFIIVTGDSDLYQLLSSRVSIYNIKTKKIYTSKDFQEEYGIYPHQWPFVKEIAGCSSDGIPGVKGVGEKGAIQFLTGKLKVSSKKYQDITSGMNKKIRERNAKLVTLPYNGTKSCKIQDDDLNYQAFLKVCESFDFQSIIKNDAKYWKQILEG